MIVPMKKAHLLILKEDREKVLKSLQRYQVLMPVDLSEQNNQNKVTQRTEDSIGLLKNYREKKKLGEFNIVDYESFIEDDPKKDELLEKIENTQAEIESLKEENIRLEDKIQFYRPWENLEIKLSDLQDSKFVRVHSGFISPYELDNVKEILDEYGSELIVLGKNNSGQAIIYFNYFEDDEEVHQKIKIKGLLEADLPKDDDKVNMIVLKFETKLNANLEKIAKHKNNLIRYASKINQLEILNDRLLSESELEKVSGKEILETLYIEGWVRSDQEDRLKESLDKATDLYDLEIRDPNDDEIPPTAYKNNKFVSQFETITNMFGTPNHKEVDPNPSMAPWYWLLFGMMMGDAGYGIALIVFGELLIKLLRPKGGFRKLIKVFSYTGITSIIWGILFNSFFGFALMDEAILFVPMDDPLSMLVLSLVIGGFHIISGILVNAYGKIRNNDLLGALFDDISWVLILLGVGLLFLPAASNIGISLIIVGVGIIILTGGRKNKGLIGKLTGGFTSLFDIANYLSDILSYSRILALSLSTAAIAMVMNMLAGMIQGSIIGIFFSIIIYIIGHAFNIVMGVLSAYVHDSRLQYVEYFGMFFEGGGYPFQPLSLKLQYVDEVTDKI